MDVGHDAGSRDIEGGGNPLGTRGDRLEIGGYIAVSSLLSMISKVIWL